MPQLPEQRGHTVAPLVNVFCEATDVQRLRSMLCSGHRTNRRAAVFPSVVLTRDQPRMA
jgi:hypothetical protein